MLLYLYLLEKWGSDAATLSRKMMREKSVHLTIRSRSIDFHLLKLQGRCFSARLTCVMVVLFLHILGITILFTKPDSLIPTICICVSSWIVCYLRLLYTNVNITHKLLIQKEHSVICLNMYYNLPTFGHMPHYLFYAQTIWPWYLSMLYWPPTF
jgi:hypothetical protein